MRNGGFELIKDDWAGEIDWIVRKGSMVWLLYVDGNYKMTAKLANNMANVDEIAKAIDDPHYIGYIRGFRKAYNETKNIKGGSSYE